MIQTQTIDWKPFSDKHKRYIKKAIKSKISVAEGSIRSGKTIDNCIIASIYLDICEDKIHLASGSTLANAKMNIGDCNGYGLEHLFRGRCRWGKYKSNECLYIQAYNGEKIVIFAGGGKADSYKKILGNSYGLWIATEINEHYDSNDSRESFIKVAFGRQVASKQPFVLWDLNPCNPHNPIYSSYIDKYRQEELDGYNYEHFTLHDNLSVSDERRKEIEDRYDKTSIWYRRDILGERCISEGVIYRNFANNPDDYITEDITNIVKANIGVDFGGNGSATTFVCTGFTAGNKIIKPILSERHIEPLDSEKLSKLFADFVKRAYELTKKSMYVYCDSAEQILIRSLKQVAITEHLPILIRNALKRPINERIRLTDKLIAQHRLQLYKGAKSLKIALCECVWDEKHPDKRLDDGSTDIDTLDAFEYSIESESNYI